jgi:transcription initiation factor TFIIIB Brf1 subunit/transcription initiation factor TFIIB
MVRRTKEEAQRIIKSIAVLLRNTTWKCGRVEKLIVNHLQSQIRKCERPRITVKEMLQHLKLSGKQKSEFLDAIKRLEKRQIIRIEGFP